MLARGPTEIATAAVGRFDGWQCCGVAFTLGSSCSKAAFRQPLFAGAGVDAPGLRSVYALHADVGPVAAAPKRGVHKCLQYAVDDLGAVDADQPEAEDRTGEQRQG